MAAGWGVGVGWQGEEGERLGGWAPTTPVGWDATLIRPGAGTVKLPVESRLSVASLIYVSCHVGEEVVAGVGVKVGWVGVGGDWERGGGGS